jgi:ABC-type transport system involved in cytochrome bd biosynthesis fused ATPase/permease subunit
MRDTSGPAISSTGTVPVTNPSQRLAKAITGRVWMALACSARSVVRLLTSRVRRAAARLPDATVEAKNPPEKAPAGAPRSLLLSGARTHNLKGVSCAIPHGKVTVVTGPSGAGKSSLVFDTLFAEGQRRFV